HRRMPFAQWLEGLGSPTPPVPRAPPPPPWHHDAAKAVKLAADPRYRSEAYVARWLDAPELSPWALAVFDELLTRLRATPGLQVVLVHLPLADGVVDRIDADPRRRAFFDRCREILARAAGPRVTVVYWERARGCGLAADAFVDYGHFTRA